MNLHAYPEIMTLEEVAEFLRTSVRSVANWASEGRIPAGKIGTSWRFKRDDVRRWVDMQLRDKSTSAVSATTFIDLVKPERTIVSSAKTKNAVIDELIDVLAATPCVKDKKSLRNAIFRRESLMSTGIGMGLGVPHVRIPAVADVAIAVSLTTDAICDYETLDDVPIRLVVMIVAREDQHAEHLRILSQLSGLLKDPVYHDRLTGSSSAGELYDNLIGKESCVST